MKTILLSFFIIVLVGCTSVAKPTIHLHSNGVSEAKLTNLRIKLEKSGYTVISGHQDFSHFLFTPLIVVPKDSKFSTPELQQQITNTLGSIPIVKRGNFKNHKYSGDATILVYIFGETMPPNNSINSLTSFAGTHTRRAASPLCPTCMRPLLKSYVAWKIK